MRYVMTCLVFGFGFFLPSTSAADDSPLLFMSNEVEMRYGFNELVTHDQKFVLNLNHASGWSWGDIYSWVDIENYTDGSNSWYGEFAPRLSLGKLGLINLDKKGFVTDLLIASVYERGKNDVESMLLGLGTNLNIKGFQFFQANLYARKDTGRGAGFNDAQLTIAWAYPFTIGGEKFVVDGYSDYVFGWGPVAANWQISPQIKWDAGHLFGLGDGKFRTGVDIHYWKNKFGIQNTAGFDTNQFALELMVEFRF